MEGKAYISEAERAKCIKVIDAFGELYDETDILVLDAGRYGFVKLDYYMEAKGFDCMETYTNSKELFMDLWDSWLFNHLYLLGQTQEFQNKKFDEIFESLTQDRQQKLMDTKNYFAKKAEIA